MNLSSDGRCLSPGLWANGKETKCFFISPFSPFIVSLLTAVPFYYSKLSLPLLPSSVFTLPLYQHVFFFFLPYTLLLLLWAYTAALQQENINCALTSSGLNGN